MAEDEGTDTTTTTYDNEGNVTGTAESHSEPSQPDALDQITDGIADIATLDSGSDSEQDGGKS